MANVHTETDKEGISGQEKHIHKTIQFDSDSEHETRQRQIRGREEVEGRTHIAQAIAADEGKSGKKAV
jgi:hypothetical protein